MKKALVIFLSALLCVSAAGCDLSDEASSVAELVESAAAEADADTEKEDSADSGEEKENKAEEKPENDDKSDDSTADNEEVTESEKPQEETAAQQAENNNEQSGGDDEAEVTGEDDPDPMALAEMYYYDACSMYQTVLLSCPYVLDYDSISDDGWAPVSDPNCTDGIKSIEDYYCNLFSEPDALIYERYKEIDGKLYCNDTARGTNIFYAGTSFELVEESEGTLVFNAVSHYEFEETGEKFEDETAVFSIVKWEDGYKVSEFTFPM